MIIGMFLDIEKGILPCVKFKDELIEKVRKEVRGEEFWDAILFDTSLQGVRYGNVSIWGEVRELKVLNIELRERARILNGTYDVNEIYIKEMWLDDLLQKFIYKKQLLRGWLRKMKKNQNLTLLLI